MLASAIPGICALCSSDSKSLVCTYCYQNFFETRHARCAQCAAKLETHRFTMQKDQTVCGTCLTHPPAFDATIVAVDYAAPIDQLILALKFGNKLAMAPLFGNSLCNVLQNKGGSHVPGNTTKQLLPAILTCVPLGSQRLVQRGFNQSLEIAKSLAATLDIPLCSAILLRLRETHPQALLHTSERKKNIRHAFIVNSDAIEKIKDQHIGVVDDVMTTGETLNEIARTLKRFGAARVTNLVFARTPAHVTHATSTGNSF